MIAETPFAACIVRAARGREGGGGRVRERREEKGKEGNRGYGGGEEGKEGERETRGRRGWEGMGKDEGNSVHKENRNSAKQTTSKSPFT